MRRMFLIGCILCMVVYFHPLIFMATYANAQDKIIQSQFENYKKVKLNNFDNFQLAPQLKYRRLKNVPKYLGTSDGGKFQLGEEYIQINCGKNIIEIDCVHGESFGGNCEILVHKNKKTFYKELAATSFVVSSTCQFYASGGDDYNFHIRRKFTITGSGIEETAQPFYLVDKVCRTSEAAILTSEQCGKGDVVAELPEGVEIKILLSERIKIGDNRNKISKCDNDKESYLVSTKYGLVGWVENTSGSIYEPGIPLSCIIKPGS
jgi:hypothetical protein